MEKRSSQWRANNLICSRYFGKHFCVGQNLILEKETFLARVSNLFSINLLYLLKFTSWFTQYMHSLFLTAGEFLSIQCSEDSLIPLNNTTKMLTRGILYV